MLAVHGRHVPPDQPGPEVGKGVRWPPCGSRLIDARPEHHNFELPEAEATIQRLLPRYLDKPSQLGYGNIDAEWLSKEMHIDFPDLRKFANRIGFKYGAPNEERAALFQMEQNRETGMSSGGQKAA